MFGLYFRLIISINYFLICFQCEDISIGWQSVTTFSDIGLEFSPIDREALFLFEINVSSSFHCAQICHSNERCRIVDFDDQSKRCRLFEGDIDTMGSIVASSSSQSLVGLIKLVPEHFADYERSCSFCEGSRYLTCINSTCQCTPHTFFNGLICQSQKLLGSECLNETDCRMDLNFTCLPRMQCGPITLQTGELMAGYGNSTFGNDSTGLRIPWGLVVNDNGSFLVSDNTNHRVLKFNEGSRLGTIVAGTGIKGSGLNQLSFPAELRVDALGNIYVADSDNHRVMLWPKNSSTGILRAGNGTSGNTLNTLNNPLGLAVDFEGNIYVSESNNHRVTKWAPNATNGTIIAGTGVAGYGSNQLNAPYSLFLDEINSYVYIADRNNHRIQRYSLNGTSNGTTVAGGNGAGTGNHQLHYPYAVFVSKKGFIYIADAQNCRVQRWSPGAMSGVTVVGITGIPGNNLTLLTNPDGVALNPTETFLYVSERNSHRVLRFEII